MRNNTAKEAGATSVFSSWEWNRAASPCPEPELRHRGPGSKWEDLCPERWEQAAHMIAEGALYGKWLLKTMQTHFPQR